MSSVDILARTRHPHVTVECFGIPWELTPSCARDWIGVIGWDADQLSGIMPGSIPEDDIEAMLVLSWREDACRRWVNAARVALGRAAGRDWWWALNLVKKVLPGWPYFNGALLLEGVDASKMPLAEWMDACYMLLWMRCDEEGRLKLDIELQTLPKGVAIRQSGAANRKMLEAFAAD